MKFNYFSCIQHSVIVDKDNIKDHLRCDVVGEMFIIKQYKKKKQPGLISQSVINAANEKIAAERWEKKQIRDKAKRIRDQERFEFQIPSGDIIINLLDLEIPA